MRRLGADQSKAGNEPLPDRERSSGGGGDRAASRSIQSFQMWGVRMTVFAHIRDNFEKAFFPRLSEWWAAALLMGVGWMLGSNPDLMDNQMTHAYDLMLMIAEQQKWAIIMKLFATARLFVLLINGAWRRSPHLRALCAILSCFFWTQIALSFAPIFGFAFMFAAGILALDFVNTIRAARDARTVDYGHARGRSSGGQN